MTADSSASVVAGPIPVAATLILASIAAFALDRLLRRTSRQLRHARAHGSIKAPRNIAAAGALFVSRPVLFVTRIAVWVGLLWLAGEISPSLRWLQSFVYVVGRTVITAPVFMLNQRGYSILDAIELPIAVLVAWLVVKYAGRLLEARLTRSGRVDTGTRDAITLLGRCVLGVAAALLILHAWGVDMSSLAIAASVIGVGIGFGLQNITSNFVSGLLVSLERPIRPGDFVKVGDLRGTVKRIGLRCTEIVTLDRVSILVPNSQILEKEVVNWSYGDPVYRLHVPVSVEYDSDVATVREALLEAAQSHRAVLREPKPRVDFHGFGESALEFELLVWARDPKQQDSLLSDINYRIEASLRAHGVEVPFPQLDVRVRAADVDEPAPEERPSARDRAPRVDGASAAGAGDTNLNGAAGVDGMHNGSARPSADALSGAFDQVSDTHAWGDAEIDALLARMRSPEGVPVTDRRYRLRVYQRCFVGCEAVDWLVGALAISRDEAVEIGRALAKRGAIHHVLHEQPFKDGRFFYRFRADEAGDDVTAAPT
jgi:small-conductance mechanosensitive channel